MAVEEDDAGNSENDKSPKSRPWLTGVLYAPCESPMGEVHDASFYLIYRRTFDFPAKSWLSVSCLALSVRWIGIEASESAKDEEVKNGHSSWTAPSIFTLLHEKQKWMSLPGTSSDRSNRRHQCNPMRQNCPRMMLASHSRCGQSLATCVARSESDDL